MKKTARASMVRMLPDFRMMALPKSVIPRASEYPDTATRLVTVGLRHGELVRNEPAKRGGVYGARSVSRRRSGGVTN